MRETYCPACKMDGGHVQGCPENQRTPDESWSDRGPTLPPECHEGGRRTCDHAEHRAWPS